MGGKGGQQQRGGLCGGTQHPLRFHRRAVLPPFTVVLNPLTADPQPAPELGGSACLLLERLRKRSAATRINKDVPQQQQFCPVEDSKISAELGRLKGAQSEVTRAI